MVECYLCCVIYNSMACGGPRNKMRKKTNIMFVKFFVFFFVFCSQNKYGNT